MRGQRSTPSFHQGYGLVYTDSLGISHHAPNLGSRSEKWVWILLFVRKGDHLNDEIFGDGKEFFFSFFWGGYGARSGFCHY